MDTVARTVNREVCTTIKFLVLKFTVFRRCLPTVVWMICLVTCHLMLNISVIECRGDLAFYFVFSLYLVVLTLARKMLMTHTTTNLVLTTCTWTVRGRAATPWNTRQTCTCLHFIMLTKNRTMFYQTGRFG